MRFGLGLGITSTFGVTAAITTWSGWDSAEDGSNLNIFTAGNFWPPTVATISEGKAIAVANVLTAGDVHAQLFTRSGTALTATGSLIKISNTDVSVINVDVIALSATRAIATYLVSGTGTRVVLLDISGSSPSVLDTGTLTGGSTSSGVSLALHTSTRAVLLRRGATKAELTVVDALTDTITFGTPLLLSLNGTGESAIQGLDTSSGVACDATNIYRYSISGTTVTVSAAQTILTSGLSAGQRSIAKLSDTRVLVTAERASEALTYNTPWNWNGTKLVRGSQTSFRTDTVFTHENGWSVGVDANHALLSYQDSSGTTQGLSTVVRIRDNNTTEIVVNESITFPDIQADHSDIEVFPDTDGLYVLQACQDDTTAPIKQVAVKVLKGTGAADNPIVPATSDWVADMATISDTGDIYQFDGDELNGGQGLRWNLDGTKFYLCGTSSKTVWQYTVSEAWKPSTVTATASYVPAFAENPYDIDFNSAGTKMYILFDGGSAKEEIRQYSLSTAFEIGSGVTYDTVRLAVTAQDTNPRGIYVSDDDTRLYMSGIQTDKVFSYTFSTAGDLSTCTYDSKSVGVGTNPDGVCFNPNLTRMYVTQTTQLREYVLTTAGDVSGTVTSGDTYTYSGKAVRGVVFKEDDGEYLYTIDTSEDIAQFGVISSDL